MRQAFAIVAGLGLAGCAGAQPATEFKAPYLENKKPMLQTYELRELTLREKTKLGKMLAQGLKDPDSAQWRWAMFPKNAEGTTTYCAQVNAKNSYGGYGGFKVFLSVLNVTKGEITTGAIGAIQDADARYSEIVPAMCAKEGLDPYKPS